MRRSFGRNFETKAAREGRHQIGNYMAPVYRVSLGDMAHMRAARGSFRQGSVEPENMMIEQCNGRRGGATLVIMAACGSFRQGDNGGMVKILANMVRKSAALGL